MKNAVSQLQLFVAKIDRRYLQIALAMFLLAMKFCAPVDGGDGPF